MPESRLVPKLPLVLYTLDSIKKSGSSRSQSGFWPIPEDSIEKSTLKLVWLLPVIACWNSKRYGRYKEKLTGRSRLRPKALHQTLYIHGSTWKFENLWPYNSWCPLKSRTYLNEPAVKNLMICLSMKCTKELNVLNLRLISRMIIKNFLSSSRMRTFTNLLG